MPKHKTKRQHIVPCFYLKRFSKEGRLWVFDKIEKKIFPSAPKDVANQNYFYDIPQKIVQEAGVEGEVDAQFVEERLSHLEGDFSRLLREILDGELKEHLFRRNRYGLAVHLVLQMLRTREYREQMHEALNKHAQALVDSLVAENYPDVASEHYPRVTYGNDGLQAMHTLLLSDPDYVLRLADAIVGHLWTIGVNKTIQPLYTSDHPVLRQGHVQEDGIDATGLMSPGIEIVFPLSSRHVLLVRERRFFRQFECLDGKVVLLDAFDIERCNALQVKKSYRQVYCEAQEFAQAEGVCRRHPEVCDPYRQRVHVEQDERFIKATFLA